eukprot:845787-Pelagomonas_calceolata.AAC.1
MLSLSALHHGQFLFIGAAAISAHALCADPAATTGGSSRRILFRIELESVLVRCSCNDSVCPLRRSSCNNRRQQPKFPLSVLDHSQSPCDAKRPLSVLDHSQSPCDAKCPLSVLDHSQSPCDAKFPLSVLDHSQSPCDAGAIAACAQCANLHP